MDIVFKSEQISILSVKLGISQKDVKRILDSYIEKVISKVSKGEPTKFLNICYLIPENSNRRVYHETLAYTSTNIGREEKIGRDVVFRVLSELSNLIAEDLKKFYSYSIRGVLSIRMDEYKRGIYKVRINKSSKLKELGVGVVAINSFKRKVEN